MGGRPVRSDRSWRSPTGRGDPGEAFVRAAALRQRAASAAQDDVDAAEHEVEFRSEWPSTGGSSRRGRL